jgi:hypothetical protein
MTSISREERVAQPLDWRVPDEHELGHENSILTALGVGGSYDIGEQSDGYILWWAADPFTFQEGFASIEDAKAAAESDWQRTIAAALSPDVSRSEGMELRAEILRLVDALEYAHSEGFEWPVDPLPFGSIAHNLFIERGNDPERIAARALSNTPEKGEGLRENGA